MLSSKKLNSLEISNNYNYSLSSLNNEISDFSDTVFGRVLNILIKCLQCDKTFTAINQCYDHYKHNHEIITRLIDSENKSNIVSIGCGGDDHIGVKTRKTRKKRRKSQLSRVGCTKLKKENVVIDENNSQQDIAVGDKPYKCDIGECSKCYTRVADLNKHKKIHFSPLICDWSACQKRFHDNSTLQIHRRTHTNEKPFKCEWPGCDYSANQIGGVISHMRSHTGEKPYFCQFETCKQSFSQQSALLAHIARKHETTKKLNCNWPGCEMRFATPGGLKRHARTHTGERPYSCDWPGCGKKFTDISVVAGHKRTHTGERPFHCDWPQCSAKFATYCTLGTHKKLVHKCDYIKRSRWDKRKINIEN